MRIRAAAILLALGARAMLAQEKPETPQAPPNQLSVKADGDYLSVRAHNTGLRAALHELARQTAVRITVAQEVEDTDISLDFGGPLDMGLRALLANYDAFFSYGGKADEPVSLRAVWVYPKGAALTLRPAPLEACTASRELESRSSDGGPAVRQTAYVALMSRADARSRELVMQAIQGLSEKDEGLRQRIFSAAIARGLAISPEMLAGMAGGDASEFIRWMALDALSQFPQARQAAEAALTDSSPLVRQKAGELMTVLAAEGQRRDGRPRQPDHQQ